VAYPQERRPFAATRARRGRLSRNILWGLVFGAALTVLGFAATWAWKAGDLAPTAPNNAASRAPLANGHLG